MFNHVRNVWLVAQSLGLFTLSYGVCRFITAWKPAPLYEVVKGPNLGDNLKKLLEKKNENLGKEPLWSLAQIAYAMEKYETFRFLHMRYRYRWIIRLFRTRHRKLRDVNYDWYNWLYVAYKNKYIWLRYSEQDHPIMALSRGGWRAMAVDMHNAEPFYIFWFDLFCYTQSCLSIYLFTCYACYLIVTPYIIHDDISVPEYSFFGEIEHWWGLPHKVETYISPWYDRHAGWYAWDASEFADGRFDVVYRLRSSHVQHTYEAEGVIDINVTNLRTDLFGLMFPSFFCNNLLYWYLQHYYGCWDSDWWIVMFFSLGYTGNLFGVFFACNWRDNNSFDYDIQNQTGSDQAYYEDLYSSAPNYDSTFDFSNETGQQDPFDDWL